MKFALFFLLLFSVTKVDAQRTTLNRPDREYLCFKINKLFDDVYKNLGSSYSFVLTESDPRLLRDTFSMNLELKAEPYKTMKAIWDEAATTISSVLFEQVLKEFRQYKAIQLTTHSIENKELEMTCMVIGGLLMYYDNKLKVWKVVK